MEQLIIYVALILVGACIGSFAGATVWRLRIRDLQYEKDHKEPYDRKEYGRLRKLQGRGILQDRSQCLECGYELRWYDLIPVVSWLWLHGKCRECKHPIGKGELFVELGMVAFFVLSYMFWPYDLATGLAITHFILWLLAGGVMGLLFVYDLRWFLLPDAAVVALGAIGVGVLGITAAQSGEVISTLLSALGAVGVLGGLYAVLFAVSKGRWVGFGDVKLGVSLGLLLVDWQLALVALFLANLIGCIIVIPGLAMKKLERTSRVPFGPMLIAGAVLAWFMGRPLLDVYLMSMGV